MRARDPLSLWERARLRARPRTPDAATAHPPPSVFYGWYIVGLVFCTNFVAVGFTVHALNVMIWTMDRDLGWGRATLAGVASVSPFVGAATAFTIGGYLDRRGGRLPMSAGLVILSLGLLAVAFVREPWQYFLLWILPVTIGSNLCGSIVGSVTLSKWFVRKRGRVMANVAMGQSLAAMLVPGVVVLALGLGSWRFAWLFLGVVPLVLVLPAWRIIRRRPEDLGLRPDGETIEAGRAPARLSADERVWTRRQLLRTRTFWLVVAAYAFSGFAAIALAYHTVAFFTDSGLGVEGGAAAASAVAAVTLLSRALWGFFLERLGARTTSITAFGIHIVLLLLFLVIRLPLVLPLAVVLRGLAQGSILPVQETVWADYFGRPTIGLVRGMALPFTMLVSAGGPAFTGAVYDRTGSYTPAFLLFIGCFAVAIAAMALARPEKIEACLGGVS